VQSIVFLPYQIHYVMRSKSEYVVMMAVKCYVIIDIQALLRYIKKRSGYQRYVQKNRTYSSNTWEVMMKPISNLKIRHRIE